MKRKCFVFLFLTICLIGFAQNKKIDTANMLCVAMYMNILRIRCLENNSAKKICSICKSERSVLNAIAIILISVIL